MDQRGSDGLEAEQGSTPDQWGTVLLMRMRV
jgi:hypothetical protein